MARWPRWAATPALVVGALLLVGCTSAAEGEIVTSQDRHRIATEIMDENWQSAAAQYPDAERPLVIASHTINDHDWVDTMVSCLRDMGIVAIPSGGSFTYAAPEEGAPDEVAVSRYVCDSTSPTASDVARYLDRKQLDALYRYYVGSVRPCLLVAGAPSPAPPTWFSFVTSSLSKPFWHPFNSVWLTMP